MGNRWVKTLSKAQRVGKVLRVYLSCPGKTELKPADYTKREIRKLVLDDGCGLEVNDLKSFTAKACLSLMLDEVPSKWKHADYLEIAQTIQNDMSFARVFVIVAGTALSYDVTSQPTAPGQVFKIRLLPLGEEKMRKALEFHLTESTNDTKLPQMVPELSTKLFREMPLLRELVTNQRCAKLSGQVLVTMMAGMDDIPAGWCRGHASVLLSTVSNKYRSLNGLRDKKPPEIRKLMLESLALTTLQRRYNCDTEGVEKNPNYLVATAKVVEAGLVERTMIPDDPVPYTDDKFFKVDDGHEWAMSPAVTLMCVSTLVPWISGVHDAADHFELLVATMMAVIRYGQTGVEFPVTQLEKGVPYSKNDKHHYYFYPTY